MRQSEDVIGYARVSTDDQDLTMQIDALVKSGIEPRSIYREHISGAAKRLPQRELAIKAACRPGGVLRVWKLDRLGRSMRDVVNIAEAMKDAGASIQTMDGIDTGNELTGRLLLHILAAAAEFERSMISARTKAGMAARKARGAKFGPKLKFTPLLLKKIVADLRALGPDKRPLYTVEQVASRHGVSPSGLNKHVPRSRSKLGKTLRGRPPLKARR